MADIVGIDYYPRHALVSAGERTLYLDGGGGPCSGGDEGGCSHGLASVAGG